MGRSRSASGSDGEEERAGAASGIAEPLAAAGTLPQKRPRRLTPAESDNKLMLKEQRLELRAIVQARRSRCATPETEHFPVAAAGGSFAAGGEEEQCAGVDLNEVECMPLYERAPLDLEEWNRLKPFPMEPPPQSFNLNYTINIPLTAPKPPRLLTKWELAKLLREAAELHRQHMELVRSLPLDKIRDRARETTKEDVAWKDLFDKLQSEGYPLFTMTPITEQQLFNGSHL